MTLNETLLLLLSICGGLAFAAWVYWLGGHKT
jgi:hypothetical protein